MTSTPQSAETEAISIVHGVCVKSATSLLPELPATRNWTQELRVTFELTAGLSEAEHPVLGQVVAHQLWQGTTEYVFSRHGNLLHFLFPDFCAGVMELECGSLSIRAKSSADAGLVFPNTILSAVLGPQTDVVLHASAVADAGQALAICGPSGAGKSSLATALSLAGYDVVSDDALRVQFGSGGELSCFPGVPELRLRQIRNWHLPELQTRVLPDERIGYLPSRMVDEMTALRALFFPIVSRDCRAPHIERVRGERCLQRLLSASRISWTGAAGASSFRLLGRLSRLVPLYDLHLPDSYLDSTTHPTELSDLMRHELGGR